jgi:pyruvate/2-oxoglutarate dehydrogenase complex dihydrolipoamide acyltransferase (E2) component
MEENPDTSEGKIDDASNSVHPFVKYLPGVNAADLPRIHPHANIFPMLEEKELLEMAESIKANEQQNRIVMYQGAILDGRNRWVACQLAGKKPRIIEMQEVDPLTFVITQNLQRRHLDTVQRSLIAEQIAMAKHGGNHNGDSPTLEQAADKMKTSRTSVATTRKIRTEAPEVHKDMARGKYKSVNAAAKAAGLKKSKGPTAEAKAKRLAKIHNFDLNTVQGTGPKGHILVCDVEKVIAARKQAESQPADKPAETKPVQSENNIVQRLNAGEIPAEVSAEVYFWNFEKLKMFGAGVSDAAKSLPVIHVLRKAVESSFETSLREIFPKLQTYADLNVTT